MSGTGLVCKAARLTMAKGESSLYGIWRNRVVRNAYWLRDHARTWCLNDGGDSYISRNTWQRTTGASCL